MSLTAGRTGCGILGGSVGRFLSHSGTWTSCAAGSPGSRVGSDRGLATFFSVHTVPGDEGVSEESAWNAGTHESSKEACSMDSTTRQQTAVVRLESSLVAMG